MNSPTKIYRGQTLTLSSDETAYQLSGSTRDIEELLIVIGSSTSVQMTCSDSISPVIGSDPVFTTYTNAGEKIIMSIDCGLETFRAKGSGTILISW